jgi:hypothetical protein
MIALLVWSWTDIVDLSLISHWPNNCAAFFISILYSLHGILDSSKNITQADVSRETCFLTLSDPDYPSAEMLSDVGDMVCCGEPWESGWSLIGIVFFHAFSIPWLRREIRSYGYSLSIHIHSIFPLKWCALELLRWVCPHNSGDTLQ